MQINEFPKMLPKILSKSHDLNLLSRVIHKKMNYTKKWPLRHQRVKLEQEEAERILIIRT